MYLIAGLGNPGNQYTFTYHNLGFLCIDYLSQKYNIPVNKSKLKAIIGQGLINGEKVILAKPQTYMNLSGESVREIAAWNKISNEKIIILYDDINLNVGKIRIRKSGSAGGHNGIKSIILNLNSEEFPRIRLGIKNDNINMDLADYVLSKIADSNKEDIYSAIEKSTKGIELIVTGNIEKAMNEFN